MPRSRFRNRDIEEAFAEAGDRQGVDGKVRWDALR
jgi:hypothetical protein